MSALGDLQRDVQAYLLGAQSTPPATVASTPGAPAAARLHVYAEGVCLRFAEVLGDDYPGVHRLLGDEAFDRLARAYCEKHPSRHPSIRWFGRHLPDFVANASPWCDAPILAEMATFEWSKGELIDAADSAVVGVEDIAAIAPERWGEMRPRPVLAARRLALEWNVPALWSAGEADDPQVEAACAEKPLDWLLWRQDLDLRWRSIEADEAWALDLCAGGGDFAELCEGLCARVGVDAAAFTAATYLKQWASDGLLASV